MKKKFNSIVYWYLGIVAVANIIGIISQLSQFLILQDGLCVYNIIVHGILVWLIYRVMFKADRQSVFIIFILGLLNAFVIGIMTNGDCFPQFFAAIVNIVLLSSLLCLKKDGMSGWQMLNKVAGKEMMKDEPSVTMIADENKALENSDAQAASKYHITVSQYRKFRTLFDLLLRDEMMNNEDVKNLLYDVLIENPKEWKTYCLSRENEYKPFYHIGKEVFVRNKNSEKYTKGIITNISFGIEWWYYALEFTTPISINDSWPSEKVYVLAKTIMDIETNKIECDDNHYVF